MKTKPRASTTLGYFQRMGTTNISRHKTMSAVSTLITAACLFLLSVLYLLSVNFNFNLNSFTAETAMIAFAEETCSQAEAAELQGAINMVPGVKSATFITKEEVFEDFKAQYGDQGTKYISPAIFRFRYVIELTDPIEAESVEAALLQLPGISNIRSDANIVRGFRLVEMTVRSFILAGSIMMLLMAFFIISNTIRLSVTSRAREFRVMRMMGAYDTFLCAPLAFEGLELGAMGGLLATIASLISYVAVVHTVQTGEMQELFAMVPTGSVAIQLFLGNLLGGAAVGVSGSIIAIQRFLRE